MSAEIGLCVRRPCRRWISASAPDRRPKSAACRGSASRHGPPAARPSFPPRNPARPVCRAAVGFARSRDPVSWLAAVFHEESDPSSRTESMAPVPPVAACTRTSFSRSFKRSFISARIPASCCLSSVFDKEQSIRSKALFTSAIESDLAGTCSRRFSRSYPHRCSWRFWRAYMIFRRYA